MSGLEALSLACNIMTVITFARETVNVCKAVYQGRSPDDQLIDIAASLAATSDELQNENQAMSPKPAFEHRLVDIASKCNVAARALDDEVKFLMANHEKGSLKETLRVAVKANWRKNRLERLEKSLHDYQLAMETQLLASIWKKCNATELQQLQGFKELRQDLQYFVSQYELGYRRMSDLVKQENLTTRDHMRKEVVRAETSIRGHVTLQTSEAKDSINQHITTEARNVASSVAESMRKATTLDYTANQRQKLLQSLKFPAMNERRNQVHDSYEGTFQWIFYPDHHAHDSSDDNLSEDELSEDEVSDDELSDDGWSNGRHVSWDSFIEWLKSDNDIYWIRGKAGSGKSTLVKFILSNPRTKSALDLRSPGTEILSHFFWKPGSRLQKTIKGLYCSLLHQTLSENPNLIDSILNEFGSLVSKDSHTDWSVKELRLTCLAALSSCPSSVCIFIDGLDEAEYEECDINLISAIHELKGLPNVKVCVSSRPEPRFQSRFMGHQHLKLEDLTAADLHRYVRGKLVPCMQAHQIERDDQLLIISALVRKAQGVFLYLCLAVQSLLRGLDGGETWEELAPRPAAERTF
ncbi:hypothetical protein DL763_004894 [Monosporascus cannonballus]|nr:hypothetical protein DL763_004894 [Monosporascus cannonballus]